MAWIERIDAMGRRVGAPAEPRRIVSLVPSLTETLFLYGAGDRVVGVTKFCVEPEAQVRSLPRVGGTKTPDFEKIAALGPDLVLANAEENERPNIERLEAMGLAVYVTFPRTVRETVTMMRDLIPVLAAGETATRLCDEVEAAFLLRVSASPPRRVRFFCPIWRRPYMTINRDTFVHDLLALCGGENIFADAPERYPTVSLEEVAARGAEVILLPDEPFPFSKKHLPDFGAHPEIPAVASGRIHFLDGKLVTWHGPRLAEALRTLPELLRT